MEGEESSGPEAEARESYAGEPNPDAAAPVAAPARGASAGPTATAQYDYEAAEDNEISFPEGAKITGLVSQAPIHEQVPYSSTL